MGGVSSARGSLLDLGLLNDTDILTREGYTGFTRRSELLGRSWCVWEGANETHREVGAWILESFSVLSTPEKA